MFWKRASTGGMFFRQTSRLVCFGSSRAVEGVNDKSVNVLELLGMVISAGYFSGFAFLEAYLTTHAGDCVLFPGDSEAAVQWARRCRRGNEPRPGTCAF